MLVVQALVGARGIEDVKCTLATHIKAFGKKRHDTTDFVPHQKITQHRLSLELPFLTSLFSPSRGKA